MTSGIDPNAPRIQQRPPAPPPRREAEVKAPAEKPEEKKVEPKDTFTPAPQRPPASPPPTSGDQPKEQKGVGSTPPPNKLFNPTGKVNVSMQGDTVTLTAQGSVSAGSDTKPGGAAIPGIKPRLQGGVSGELSAQVKVEVPKAGATEALRSGQLPNPADPSSLPTGTKLTAEVKSEVGANGTLARGLKGLGGAVRGALGLNANLERTDGAKVELEKVNADTMRATVTRTTEQGDGASVRGIGAQQQQSLTRTQQADFKINTPEGRAAYDNFLKTGQLPTTNAPGVEGTKQTVEKNVAGGPTVLGRQLGGGETNVRIESTDTGHRTTASGSGPGLGEINRDTVTTPQGIHSRTDINGIVSTEFKQLNGQPPSKEYTLKFDEPKAAQLARAAFTGELKAGQEAFQVKMTEDQARTMLRNALNARQPGSGDGMRPEVLDRQLAVLSARGQQDFAQQLFGAAFPPAGRPRTLAGQVQ